MKPMLLRLTGEQQQQARVLNKVKQAIKCI